MTRLPPVPEQRNDQRPFHQLQLNLINGCADSRVLAQHAGSFGSHFSAAPSLLQALNSSIMMP